MKVNRRSMVLGVVALGFAGAIATGIGVAQAAPGGSPTPSASGSAWRGHGGAMGGYGMMGAQRTCLSAAATYLGLSESDLQTQLQSGKSLADVAKAKGKSESGLKDAMVAAAQKAIDANTSLTAEQKKTAIDQARSRIETMITSAHRPGAGMGMGGMRGGHGMMGNRTTS